MLTLSALCVRSRVMAGDAATPDSDFIGVVKARVVQLTVGDVTFDVETNTGFRVVFAPQTVGYQYQIRQAGMLSHKVTKGATYDLYITHTNQNNAAQGFGNIIATTRQIPDFG